MVIFRAVPNTALELFGRIRIDYSYHYSVPKRIFGTALVIMQLNIPNSGMLLKRCVLPSTFVVFISESNTSLQQQLQHLAFYIYCFCAYFEVKK